MVKPVGTLHWHETRESPRPFNCLRAIRFQLPTEDEANRELLLVSVSGPIPHAPASPLPSIAELSLRTALPRASSSRLAPHSCRERSPTVAFHQVFVRAPWCREGNPKPSLQPSPKGFDVTEFRMGSQCLHVTRRVPVICSIFVPNSEQCVPTASFAGCVASRRATWPCPYAENKRLTPQSHDICGDE